MKKIFIALFLCLLLAVPTYARWDASSSGSLTVTTIGSLPAASSVDAGTVYVVTDAGNASTCSSAGGTDHNLCVSNGTIWVIAGDGTGGVGSGSMTTVEEDNVAVGDADIVTLDFGAGVTASEDPNTEINIVFDATELDAITWSDAANASNTWTFDVSGTNTTMAFGSAMVTFGHDITISGDDLYMGTNTDGMMLMADGTNFNPVQVAGDVEIDNAGATVIQADAVEESMLKFVDEAADESIMTSESTTGDFEWHTFDEIVVNMSEGLLPNDSIVEADLKFVDAAADEAVMTYEDTTGDFEWHTIDELVATISEGALTNDSIVEADLKFVDEAADEAVMTYESTTGDFEWHTVDELVATISAGALTDASVQEDDLAAALAFDDGDQIDLSGITYVNTNAANEGLAIPTWVDGAVPADGKPYIAYDAANDRIMVYEAGGWADTSSGAGVTDTAAFVTWQADGSMSAEQVLTGGTGITVTLAGGDGGAATLSFDGTELDGDTFGNNTTGTWTFDGGGTDATLAYGDAVLTLSHLTVDNDIILDNAEVIDNDTDGSIIFTDGTNEIAILKTVGSAATEITLLPNTTGLFPTIQATGEADAGIDFENSEGEEILQLNSIATSINYLKITSSAAGNPVLIDGVGDDTDVGITIDAQADGTIIIGSADASFRVISDGVNVSTAGAISGATTVDASGVITGGTITDGTFTSTSGAVTGIATLGTGPITATGTSTFATAASPDAAGGATLGSASAEWEHLYLHDSAVIYGEADSSNTITSSATGWTFAKNITAVDADFTGTTTVSTLTQSATADPTWTASDSTATAVGTFDIKVDAITATYGAQMNFYVDEGNGSAGSEDDLFMTINGNAASTAGTIEFERIGNFEMGITSSNGTAGGGFLDLYEDEDDGSNRVRIIAPAMASNYTITLPTSGGTDGYVLKTDGNGLTSWTGAGSATAWDDLEDPDNNARKTITFDNAAEATTLSSAYDTAGSFFVIDNTDADHANNTYLLDLDYSVDDGDVDADYIKAQDAGGVVFTLQQDGDMNTTGTFVTTSNAITLGDTSAGDPVITFDSGNDATITWDEDNHELELGDSGGETLVIDLDHATDQYIGIDGSVSGATHLDFAAMNLVTTGAILGDINVISTAANPYTLSAENAAGSAIFATGALEIDLPAGSSGMSILVYSTGANEILIDPNASEVIVLNGTALTGGYRISIASGAAAGDFIGLMHNGTNWYTLGSSGTWADKGS